MVMEDQKYGRNKTHSSTSSGGGGGIAGLLVLGGALAVTGFMAVASFANKKDKAKGTHDHKPKPLAQDSMDEGGWKSEDVPFFNCSTDGTSNMGLNQVNSSELLSTQTLNLEEKLDLKTRNEEKSPICSHQEIVFFDDSPPESAVSSNDNGVGKECLSSLFTTDRHCFKGEDSAGLKSMGIIEAQNEDEDEDGVEPDYVLQSGQYSSEATGRSSLDSNEEAVWPAEMIEEPEQQFKGEMLLFQSQTDEGTATKRKVSGYDCDPESYISSDSSSDYAGNERAVTPEADLAEKPNSCVLLSDEPSVSHSSKVLTWIILMLLLALLLLFVLFTYGFPVSYYVDDDGNSVLVP